jgi:2-polyprenyl-3-methyl-5-hydroxy-6-metoxy-1,4-benzoquinol methylase
MSPARLRDLVDDDYAWLSCSYADDVLVGYCVAVDTEVVERGRVAWVSQLVVHTSFRNAKIGTKLLYSIWQFSDCYAWGLATASPYAIRALETATRRPCRASLIADRGAAVLREVRRHVDYMPESLVVDDHGRRQPRVDTQFYLDHAHVPGMRRGAARQERPWSLGTLEEGQEWFGCTFVEQEPSAIDDEHLTELLTGADNIWIQAYEGMTLDDDHAWRRSADREVATVRVLSGVDRGARILDVGCGDGRHVAALSGSGCDVTGADISERLIARARDRVKAPGVTFVVADARKGLPSGPFDLAVSLYDVIGSSAREEDDLLMLRTIASSLRAGGHLIASVMNATPTAPYIPPERRPRSNAAFISALERLPASRTMERTGAVFDPELLLVYRDVHYRKEQFQALGGSLPSSLSVTDGSPHSALPSLSGVPVSTSLRPDLSNRATGTASHPLRKPIDERRKSSLLRVFPRSPDLGGLAAGALRHSSIGSTLEGIRSPARRHRPSPGYPWTRLDTRGSTANRPTGGSAYHEQVPDLENGPPSDPVETAARELRERLQAKSTEYEEERGEALFQAEIKALETLTQDFLFTLQLASVTFTRYPHAEEWMLQRFGDDLVESAISVLLLAREGVFNVGRRELRYVLEATTKYVYIDQQLPGDAALVDRVALIGDTTRVPRSSVRPIGAVKFRLVDPEAIRHAVTSAFGALSGYTHASQNQLDERLRRAARGEWTGFENAATLRTFNRLLFNTYDVVLTLIFEGIGPTFTADIFEQVLSGRERWRYHRGKFVKEVRGSVGH